MNSGKGWRKGQRKKISLEELRDLYRSLLVPNKEIISLIKKLAEKYSLFVASNTAREWLNWELDRFKLRPLFDVVATSVEAGARKPKPEFFKFLLKKLRHPPEVCLFIDDREKNTRAASEFGFQTIVFKDLPNLKARLAKR